MNRYETFIIFEADLPEEDRKTVLDRVEALISADSGTLLVFDEWGSRKLAYPIQKKNQGYYVRTDYCATGNAVEAIERILSQDHRILRFMTIRLEEDADGDALKAEMTKPEEKPAAIEPEENIAETETEAAETETPAAEEETSSTGEPESADKE